MKLYCFEADRTDRQVVHQGGAFCRLVFDGDRRGAVTRVAALVSANATAAKLSESCLTG
jgi:hypothetical protein